MAHICFYSEELSPVTRGGIGSLLWDALHALPAQGHDVTVIAALERELVLKFNREFAPSLPGPGTVTVHWLYDLVRGLEQRESEFFSPALHRSFAAKEALVELVERRGQRFDLVEFPDWLGRAYCTLVEKCIGRHLTDTAVGVRTHGTMEHWTSFEAFPSLDLENYLAGRMEAYCLRHADWVLCPSQPWARVCRERYGTPPERMLISPPSLMARDTPRALGRAGAPDVILCHGKLQQTKGVDIFVDAAVRLLSEEERAAGLTFVLTGADFHRSPQLGSEVSYLEQRIPARFRERFRFTGHLSRSALEGLFGRTLFAVIPSRTESYGYAAHEVYAAGIPVVVSDIPAFAETFRDDVNCLKFDGSVTDLHRQMKRLLEQEELRQRLRHPEPIEDETLGGVYSRDLSPPPPQAAPAPVERVSAFVLAEGSQESHAAQTIASLAACDEVAVTTWLLTPWGPADEGIPVWLLGRSWRAHGADGQPAEPEQVCLEQAAILLTAGDTVDARFLPLACQTLTRDESVGMVASWHTRARKRKERALESLVLRYPWEIAPELAPLVRGRLRSRAVFRCRTGLTLDQWMEERLGAFAEIDLAWLVLEQGKRIYTVPEELVHCKAEGLEALRLSEEDVGRLSLLLDPSRNQWLQHRLPVLFELLLTGTAADEGPLTIEQMSLLKGAQTGAPPRRAAHAFYGKKWLLRQLVRELVRSPLPGFLRRKR